MNFVAAVAYHFCLALPAAFTQPGDHLLAEICTLWQDLSLSYVLLLPIPIFSRHGDGGHYHYDTTPDEVEYIGYFNLAEGELVSLMSQR